MLRTFKHKCNKRFSKFSCYSQGLYYVAETGAKQDDCHDSVSISQHTVSIFPQHSTVVPNSNTFKDGQELADEKIEDQLEEEKIKEQPAIVKNATVETQAPINTSDCEESMRVEGGVPVTVMNQTTVGNTQITNRTIFPYNVTNG